MSCDCVVHNVTSISICMQNSLLLLTGGNTYDDALEIQRQRYKRDEVEKVPSKKRRTRHCSKFSALFSGSQCGGDMVL